MGGQGWYPLIERLSTDLAAIVRQDGLSGFRLQQVKEKLCGLRVYAHGGNHRTDARIRQAEEEADRRCEGCGATPAQLRSIDGWWTNRCERCIEHRQQEQE